MGKTQPQPAPESQKRPKRPIRVSSSAAASTETSEFGTQTVCAELGSFQDFREKLGDVMKGIQGVMRYWEGERTAGKAGEREGEPGLKCPVCHVGYEAEGRPPVCMPCGHTICQRCTSRSLCPLDQTPFDSSSLRINHLLLELHETLTGSLQVLCPSHSNPSIGFCVTDSSLLCGLCLFSHKDHVCWSLESDQAHSLAMQKKQTLEMRLEKLKKQENEWTVISSSIEVLWGNLTMTPLAMSLGMYGSMMYAQGTSEHWLVVISEELTKVMAACHQLTEVLRYQCGVMEKRLEAFARLSMSQKLEVGKEGIPMLPEMQEMIVSFGILINRLNYSQSYSMMLPLNQAF